MGNIFQEIVEKGFVPDRRERFWQGAKGLPQPCAQPTRKNDYFGIFHTVNKRGPYHSSQRALLLFEHFFYIASLHLFSVCGLSPLTLWRR